MVWSGQDMMTLSTFDDAWHPWCINQSQTKDNSRDSSWNIIYTNGFLWMYKKYIRFNSWITPRKLSLPVSWWGFEVMWQLGMGVKPGKRFDLRWDDLRRIWKYMTWMNEWKLNILESKNFWSKPDTGCGGLQIWALPSNPMQWSNDSSRNAIP